jgi:hypothetical protein
VLLTEQVECFVKHSYDAFFISALEHFVWGEPGDFVGFVADADVVVGMGDHQEANVVVFVSVFDHLALCVVAGRDVVHVDVEWHDDAVNRDNVETSNARLLASFAEGDFFDVPLAVCMAAELQPAVKFAVVREERAASIGRDDPSGGRDVTRTACTIEAVRVALDEPTDTVDHRGFGRKDVAIAGQHVKKWLAGHGTVSVVGGPLFLALSGNLHCQATDDEQRTTDNYGSTTFCVEPARREYV